MTKNEIIHLAKEKDVPHFAEKINGEDVLTVSIAACSDCMDEYAKQQCIVFGAWIYVYGYQHSYTTSNWYHVSDHTKTFTTEELYTKFLTNQYK